MLEALPLLRVKVTINKVQTSAADNPPGEIGEAGPGVLALCSSTGGTSGKNGSDVIICSRIYQNSRISFMSHLFFFLSGSDITPVQFWCVLYFYAPLPHFFLQVLQAPLRKAPGFWDVSRNSSRIHNPKVI